MGALCSGKADNPATLDPIKRPQQANGLPKTSYGNESVDLANNPYGFRDSKAADESVRIKEAKLTMTTEQVPNI